jgi:hypothetical protein
VKGSKAVTFLKKSNQKTFVLRAGAFSTPREAEQKFFGSFFQKRTSSLSWTSP